MRRIWWVLVLWSVSALAQSAPPLVPIAPQEDAPTTEPNRCLDDDDCAAVERCDERRRSDDRKHWWVGRCVEGERTAVEGPAPIKTRHGPPRFEYSGGTVPAGYELHSKLDGRFLAPGIGGFVGFYALSQVLLVFARFNAWSLVPIVGPMIQFFEQRRAVTLATSGEFNIALAGTIGQAVSAAAIVIGIVKPVRWLEPSNVSVVPTPGGVAVVGAF